MHVRGKEYSASKKWRRTTTQFEKQFPVIVAIILTLLRCPPTVCEDRLREEEIRRTVAERAEYLRQIKLAKAEQLKKAFGIAMKYDRVAQLKKFIESLETELSSFNEPYKERARVCS